MSNDATASAAETASTSAVAPSGPRPTSRSLHEVAQLLGGRVWLERQLFERLGAWSSGPGTASARLHLADASRRHGWHAQVWFDRLPELSVIDAEALVVAPDGRLVELFERLDGVPSSVDDDAAVVRLDGYGRVLLPRMIVAYRSTLDRLGVAADASLARWSRIVLADDLDEWERGESVLQGAVRSAGRIEALAASRRSLEELVLGGPLLPV